MHNGASCAHLCDSLAFLLLFQADHKDSHKDGQLWSLSEVDRIKSTFRYFDLFWFVLQQIEVMEFGFNRAIFEANSNKWQLKT